MKKMIIYYKNGNKKAYASLNDDIKVTVKEGFFMIENEENVRFIDSSLISELLVTEVKENENE